MVPIAANASLPAESFGICPHFKARQELNVARPRPTSQNAVGTVLRPEAFPLLLQLLARNEFILQTAVVSNVFIGACKCLRFPAAGDLNVVLVEERHRFRDRRRPALGTAVSDKEAKEDLKNNIMKNRYGRQEGKKGKDPKDR